MENLFIIYSCKKNLGKANLLYNLVNSKINCKCYIVFGDPTIHIPYILHGQYLILNCKDEYEHLCEKTLYLCKTVYELFPTIHGMFKCDDDIFPNIKKIDELIKMISTQYISYLGFTWNIQQDYLSTWHYNKCSSQEYNVPKICNKSNYAAGPLYYINKKSLSILATTPMCSDYFFEDSMVGHILNQHNIFPYHDITHTDKIEDTTTCIHNCNNTKHIYVLLMGGIGNQLFQVTCAYTLAKQYNRLPVILIGKNYKQYMPHNNTYNEFMSTVFNKFNYTYYENIDLSKVTVYMEKKWYEYNPNIITSNTDYLLTQGYFQNKNYFNPSVIPLFKNEEICNSLLTKYPNIVESYFIHFRLGDYLTSGNLYEFNKDDYYSKAIEYILNINKNAHFYILSDDVEFIKTYPILSNLNKTIISKLDTVHSLYLMSLCKQGGICANSTFSGWGATLNENKDKIVICPKQWINIQHKFEIPFHYTILF